MPEISRFFDIIDAKYVDNFNVEVTFETGEKGIVDFKEYLHRDGFFSSLKDVGYFKKIYVNKDIGTICWPNGLDIAPETVYSKLMKAKNP